MPRFLALSQVVCQVTSGFFVSASWYEKSPNGRTHLISPPSFRNLCPSLPDVQYLKKYSFLYFVCFFKIVVSDGKINLVLLLYLGWKWESSDSSHCRKIRTQTWILGMTFEPWIKPGLKSEIYPRQFSSRRQQIPSSL